VAATPANVADSAVLPQLLHGEETRVWGDQAYRGQTRAIKATAPRARDLTNQRYRYLGIVNEAVRDANRIKSKTRARVEHVFAVMKLKFGFTKVRYRGMAKNTQHLHAACALVNLFMARGHLMRRAV